MAFNINLDLKWLLIPVAIIIGLVVFNVNQCNGNAELDTYNRQLSGDLSSAERELQEAHYKLGVSKSKLMTQEDLMEKLRKDNEEKDAAFERFKEENNLVIKSRDKTIASLKQKIEGGISEVVLPDVEGCIDLNEKCLIGYNWKDNLGRFQLKDPNIFNSNDEVFETNQLFKVFGEIYRQEDSSLLIRRLVLREVYKDAESGEYKDIPDAKADIVDSQFDYHNPPTIDTEWKWTDLFRLRAIALTNIAILPNSGDLSLGLGLEFFSFKGLGINTHTTFNFTDPEKFAQNIGIAYNPTIMDTELNLGVHVSIGTPFAKFFQGYVFSTGLIFYLNN